MTWIEVRRPAGLATMNTSIEGDVDYAALQQRENHRGDKIARHHTKAEELRPRRNTKPMPTTGLRRLPAID